MIIILSLNIVLQIGNDLGAKARTSSNVPKEVKAKAGRSQDSRWEGRPP